MKHPCMPQVSEADMDRVLKLVNDKPWLIPSTVFLEMIPVSIVAYGFWKNRRLKTRLKIEHEKTMRAYMKYNKSREISLEEQHFLKRL